MTVRPALLSHRQTDTAHQFGVQKPELKAIARVPQLPQPKMPAPTHVARDAAALLRRVPALPAGSSLKIGISRDQKEIVVQVVP
jgi:hypothetical protein